MFALRKDGDQVKINQAILDELRTQATRQSKRNYRQVEVDCRTLLALIHEIERCRLVDLRFESVVDTPGRD